MARTTIDRDSIELVHVAVTAPAGTDLSIVPCVGAVLPKGTRPTEDDWEEADWDDTTERYSWLVGPFEETGNHGVWLKATANPETPLLPAGYVTVR